MPFGVVIGDPMGTLVHLEAGPGGPAAGNARMGPVRLARPYGEAVEFGAGRTAMISAPFLRHRDALPVRRTSGVL